MTALPVLYSFRRCPYAMRARLALVASGTACELREVRLSAKPAELLAASPKGTVPVIVLPGDEVIDESLDIMRWSLARRDPLGWLERDDPALIAASDGPFKHDLDRAKYPQRHDSDAAVHRLRGLEFLRELEARLSANGQLCGAEPGLADMAIMPFARQFAAIDGDWFAAQSLARVQAWLAGHVGSDLFAAIMVRVSPWRQGDAPTPFAQF